MLVSTSTSTTIGGTWHRHLLPVGARGMGTGRSWVGVLVPPYLPHMSLPQGYSNPPSYGPNGSMWATNARCCENCLKVFPLPSPCSIPIYFDPSLPYPLTITISPPSYSCFLFCVSLQYANMLLSRPLPSLNHLYAYHTRGPCAHYTRQPQCHYRKQGIC